MTTLAIPIKMHASLLSNGRNLKNSYEAVLLKLYIALYNVRLRQIYDSDGRTYLWSAMDQSRIDDNFFIEDRV